MNIYNTPKIDADPNSTEVIEDNTPVLFKVVDEIGPHQISLYIGNGEGAECSELLMREGITQSLNIGINIFHYLLHYLMVSNCDGCRSV